MQDRSAGPQPEQLHCCQTAAGIAPQCCPVLCVVPAWVTAGPCLPSYPTVWHAIIEDIEAQNQQWNHSSSFEKFPGMKHLCFRLQNLDHDSHSVFACIQFVQHMPMRPSHSDPPVMVCGVPQVLDTAGHHIPAASAKLSLRAQMSKVCLGLRPSCGPETLETLCQTLSNKWENILFWDARAGRFNSD